jgi:hypothetical protein
MISYSFTPEEREEIAIMNKMTDIPNFAFHAWNQIFYPIDPALIEPFYIELSKDISDGKSV